MGQKLPVPDIVVELEKFMLDCHKVGYPVSIGIDPGIEGAITLMVELPKKRARVKVFDIPTFGVDKKVDSKHMKQRKAGAVKKGQKKKVKRTTTRREYDYLKLAAFFQVLAHHVGTGPIYILVEKVVVTLFRPGGKPCPTCKRMFGLTPYSGVAVGIANAMWPMTFHTHGWNNFQYVRPQVWKKYFNLIKRDKNAARAAAQNLFVRNAVDFCRVKDHNRAESALLAAYAFMHREMFSGSETQLVSDSGGMDE